MDASEPAVTRPVVRAFRPRFLAEAAAWVRAGGHAVLWDQRVDRSGRSRRHATLIVGPIDGTAAGQLSLFSLLDLRRQRWRRPGTGPFAGLTTAVIPPGDHGILADRVSRDGAIPGPTQRLPLDCLACGACCKDNEVYLDASDLARFHAGGRPELARPPFARRRDGKLMMTLLRGRERRCRHLAGDNRCAIYELRPSPCRDFPAGSECCLFTRASELGLGVAPPPENMS